MIDSLISRIFFNQWAVFLFTSLLLLALAEIGFRIGIFSRNRNPDAASGHSANVHGAVLGLLGLLLGFTFAMAVSRHDNRRQLAIDEANAIGTTWLRAPFLGDEPGQEARRMLKHYTELRLTANAAKGDEEALNQLIRESSEIQNSLWALADTAARQKPDPMTASFVTTLNETIDLQSSRLAAHRNHVPSSVWLLLLIVAGCGAGASGYVCGGSGYRSSFNQIIFPILIGIVITLITDMDSPSKGFIGVSQQPMRDLLESMKP